MKSKYANLPCTTLAEATIIATHSYEGYGHYVKMIQILTGKPKGILYKDQLKVFVEENGFNELIVKDLLSKKTLFLEDEHRFMVRDEKVINKLEKAVDNPKITEEIPPEHLLQKSIRDRYPRVYTMKGQPDFDQCVELTRKYPKGLISEKLAAMENRKTLLQDYASCYLTLNNWCRMAMQDGWTDKSSPVGTVKATAVREV